MKSTLEEVTGMKLQNKPRKAVLKSTGELEPIEYNDQLVEFVYCHECNCQHLTHQESYLEVMGNLHVGGTDGGGLLGNGDWKNIGVPVYYFCINNRCLSNYIRKAELKELTKQGQLPEIGYLTSFEVSIPVPIDGNHFLKPETRYCIVNRNDEGDVVIEGMIYKMKVMGEYAEHKRIATSLNTIQEWVAKCMAHIIADTVTPITLTEEAE